MKEVVQYSDRVSLMTSNEPTTEMSQILHIASTDDEHTLSANYKNVGLDDSLFYNVVLLDNTPVMFFYLQQSDWMPSHAARAYTRFYKDKKIRDRKYHMEFAGVMGDILDYHQRRKWLDVYGIDTLFFTRNVDHKNDAVRYWAKHKWNQYPHPCNIHGVVQHVMWKGEPNLEFLATRVVAQSE